MYFVISVGGFIFFIALSFGVGVTVELVRSAPYPHKGERMEETARE